MPLLAAFFGGLFTRLIDYFALYVTRKVAVYAAAVTAITTLTTALVAFFVAAVAGLASAFPVAVGTALVFIPDNIIPCLSSYLSCAAAKWVYDWNSTLILKTLNV